MITENSEGSIKNHRSEDSNEGIAIPSITLPKAGGAIRNIGEKFSVDAITGTGSMSVPIFTSVGRSNFSPRLVLSYNSGAGNGPFGLGWQLSAPSLTRKTDKGLPLYRDQLESDVFLLSDAEDLMPSLSWQGGQWLPETVADATWNGEVYAIKRYRPRTEVLFARIERWQRKVDGDLHWRAVTKDNVCSIYGLSGSGRLADPADNSRIFQWLLETTFDDKGNVIFYQYKAEDTAGIDLATANERNRRNGFAPCTNRYLKRIQYGNQTPYLTTEDLTKRADWLFEVVFDYGEHAPANPTPAEEAERPWLTRADPFSSYRSTFDIRCYRLCQRVLMFHHFPANSEGNAGYDGLTRSTDFIYDSVSSLPQVQGNPVATKLLSITQTGYSLATTGAAVPGYTRKSFPPVEFTYSEATIDPNVCTLDPASLANLPAGADGASHQWVDLDGEGLTGILAQQAAGFLYKRNWSPLSADDLVDQATARFGPAELIATNPVLAPAGGRPQFMSLAADGHQDLVSFSGSMRGVYRRMEASWEGFSPFRLFPNLDVHNPNVKFIDVDGDGLIDILVSEDEVFSWYPSLGEAGFGAREYARKPYDEERGPALVFADPAQSIFTADMSGDGLTDIVRIRNGEVCYWPNLGYGRFGAKVAMDAAPFFDTPDAFEPRRIRLADIDGSGTTDILYLATDHVGIYLNQSGNSLAAKEPLPGGFPKTSLLQSVSVVDLLGNGTACLVWSSPLPADFGRQMRYVDLTGSVKPHLLTGVTNNLGAETRIQYAASTKFYVQDRAEGKPWITRLPFPVYVVEQVDVFDYIGKTRLTTGYRYRHGYFDGVEREFRGFGYVEQTDAEAFGESNALFAQATAPDAVHVPPVVTKTWFHTGAWPDGSSVSRQMAFEYYALAGGDALLPDTILPSSVFLPQVDASLDPPSDHLPYALTGEEQREALRALKGGILRQEITDGNVTGAVPYSVSERNYTVECLQPRAGNRYAVFLTHARETIDYELERKTSDPRVHHDAVLAVDVFGNVTQSVRAGYGRNLVSAGVKLAPEPGAGLDLAKDPSVCAQPEQLTTRMTLHEVTLTNAVDSAQAYRTPLPSEARTYEITCPVRLDDSVIYTFAELQALAAAAVEIAYESTPDLSVTQKRLLDKTRTLYLKDDLSAALAPGVLEPLGLVYQTYQLALTAPLAQQIFLTGNSNPARPADLAALATTLTQSGAYIHSQDDADWWIPSGLTFYSPVPAMPPADFVQDAAFAAAHFYLPQAHRDAFGSYAWLSYDPFNLLLQQTQDALGNVVAATGNYRVLQPQEMVDPNGNHTELAFDVLGMVVGTAVKGKVTAAGDSESGDSLTTFQADLAQADLDGFIDGADLFAAAPGLLGTATTRVLYDIDRFLETRTANPDDPTKWEPIFAATLARETHVNPPLPAGQPLKIQVSLSYSDGLGREIQKKIQAEPGPTVMGGPVVTPRWVGTGWTIFNNKGKPVRQYEPFFTAEHAFEFAHQVGVSATVFYDPLLRPVLTLHPDHTYAKVLFDPWHQVSWDANDTVLLDPRTDPDLTAVLGDYFQTQPAGWQTWLQQLLPDPLHPPQDSTTLAADQAAAVRTLQHAGTPGIACLDNLGRTFLAVANNGPDAQGRPQFYATRTGMDIEGNQLSVTDARGRVVMTYAYGLLKNRLHQMSMDAGERWTLSNVVGKPICAWDSRGYLQVVTYDALQRPVTLQVTGNGVTNLTVEKTLYGDDSHGALADPVATNHRGRIYQACDAAGTVTHFGVNPTTKQNEGYDFKGNVLRSVRGIVSAQYKATLDWGAPQNTDQSFTSSGSFDALNRPTSIVTPDASEIRHTFNEANLLGKVDIRLRGATEWKPFVTAIDYNAKGQREQMTYGNGASTSYDYDPLTFRLVHLRTTRPAGLNGLASQLFQDAGVIQDLAYTYDPAGNIARIRDNALPVQHYNNQEIDPQSDYSYDPIYRLVSAQGREHSGQTAAAPEPQTGNLRDYPFVGLALNPNDLQAVRNFSELYGYDAVGNFNTMTHVAAGNSWTRTYFYNERSPLPGGNNNRLSATQVGTGPMQPYTYDAHGNMVTMPHLPTMAWNFKDQLSASQQQVVNNGAGEKTYYIYDGAGQRVRKVTETAGGVKKNERLYLGGFEVYMEYDGTGATTLARETLHVMDDTRRIAMVETLTQGTDSPAQLIRYQLSNHLGSASLELDDACATISYEEYYPYGTSSYQAARSQTEAAKRYRYTGKERDEETGFGYHSARYYAPWLGKWTSCDPAGLVDGFALFTYVRNNPIKLFDVKGTDSVEGDHQPPAPPPRKLGFWEEVGIAIKVTASFVMIDTFGPGGPPKILDFSHFTEVGSARQGFLEGTFGIPYNEPTDPGDKAEWQRGEAAAAGLAYGEMLAGGIEFPPPGSGPHLAVAGKGAVPMAHEVPVVAASPIVMQSVAKPTNDETAKPKEPAEHSEVKSEEHEKASKDPRTQSANPPTKSNRPVTREQRWRDLANNPHSNLPRQVRNFIKRHGGKGVREKFGLELAHPPKRANAQGYDYAEALPKHASDHATQHRYLRERTTGTTIKVPKGGTTGRSPLTRPPPLPTPG